MANRSLKLVEGRRDDLTQADDNRDPLTGEPGAHPVGAGLGAASAGVAGAAIGSMAGPIGAVAGAVIGSLAGGLAGKEVAENLNPTDPAIEDAYWKENYRTRPYVRPEEDYEVFRPAYQYGWEARMRHLDRRFDDVEGELENDWRARQASSKLEWERARVAARDAWERIEHPSERETRYDRRIDG